MRIPNVYDNGEAGLLSVALHPSFLANGRFFAYYSQTLENHPVTCTAATAVEQCGKYIACDAGRQLCTGDHVSVVSEFQSVNLTEGLANSSREVRTVSVCLNVATCNSGLTRPQLQYFVQPFGNHNGGLLLFDPEGYMMIFLGGTNIHTWLKCNSKLCVL